MIGIILKNIRKIRKLTQTQIGSKLNLAENTISNYETEYSNPTFETVNKFVDVCDFDIQFLDRKTRKVFTIEDLSKEMDF